MELLILGVLGVIVMALGYLAMRVERLRDDVLAWRASDSAAIARASARAEERAARRGSVSVNGRLAARQERTQ